MLTGGSFTFICMSPSLGAICFRRRRSHIAAINAIRPITPRATPTPIPASAPVDRPLGGVVEDVGETTEGVCDELATVVAEVEDIVDIVSAGWTFHPTIAIAPTLEASARVVEVIVHEYELSDGVDAYVNVTPASTLDRQFPPIEPACPFAR